MLSEKSHLSPARLTPCFTTRQRWPNGSAALTGILWTTIEPLIPTLALLSISNVLESLLLDLP